MPKVLGLSTTENYMMEHGHSVQAEVKKMFEETNARYKAAIDKHQRHNVFQKGMWSSNVRRGFYLTSTTTWMVLNIQGLSF